MARKRTYTVGADEAGSQFAELLQKVRAGGEVIIIQGDQPVAMLSAPRNLRRSPSDADYLFPKRNKVGQPVEGIVWTSAQIPIKGPDAGKAVKKTDEELAAEQGISVETVQAARAKVLNRAYRFILGDKLWTALGQLYESDPEQAVELAREAVSKWFGKDPAQGEAIQEPGKPATGRKTKRKTRSAD